MNKRFNERPTGNRNEIANEKQIIFQRKSTLSNNITLALSQSSDTGKCNLVFGISEHSNNGYKWSFVTGSLTSNPSGFS